MTSPRRIGAPDAKNRTVLLDATEQLMLEEGYAAVTSRRVASKAGLKPQLVHYYFRTMDDLFLAVFQRRAEAGLQVHAQALASDQPLRALWAFSTDATDTALTGEFVALGNHRKTIKAAIADYSERFRLAQIEALTDLSQRYGIDTDAFPPGALSVLLTSISRVVIMEEALGFSAGHAEALALVERHLQRLEGDPKPVDAQSSTS
jgi:AcrR family transcriptional regulator